MAKKAASDSETSVPVEPTKPRRSLKKILILAVFGILLAGGGLAAYVLVVDEPPTWNKAQASHTDPKDRVIMPLEPFLVNLADKESRRYLKLKVDLEVDSEETVKELEKVLPRIRDALILLLSSKTYLDLSTMEGKQRLKKEIKRRVSALPDGKKVSDVFFTQFVAQ